MFTSIQLWFNREIVKNLIFVFLFFVFALISFNVNLSHIRVFGDSTSNAPKTFTLFQFIGPTAGAFLSTSYGLVVVFIAQLTDFIIKGKEFSIASILFLFPALGAVYFFSAYAKKKAMNDILTYLIPIAAISLFAIHPVGRDALLYTSFWLIPIIVKFLPKNLFLRSLGATFTTHAIGSTIWLYLFETSSAFWLALIPIVIVERITFALGISVTFIVFNTILNLVSTKIIDISKHINIEKEYALRIV
ncbi:MAG: hypothetical protein QXJ06_03230 [Candidatus Aenigmatarchaeota archaeon]